MVSVAIDGPAGAGKSTLARRLAADFGYIYVDTGAMFRTIGLYALRAGKDPKDNEAVNALLPNITLEFAFIEGEQHIYLNGEDVSTAIRTEEVGMAASAVGANPAVRAFLLEMQRDMARTQNILMDGRDIGTVVLPNAVDGIVTGCILAVGRIVGESAALLFTAGAAEVIAKSVAKAYTSNGATLSVLLYLRAFEDGDFASAWGIGAVLLVLVLAINLAARLAKTKLKQKQ